MSKKPNGRAVMVHSLADARLALAAAEGRPVTLVSAPGAAGYVGAAWFREVVDLARAEHPHLEVTAIIDCADRPGHALAALRQGLRHLRFAGRGAAADKLAAIAGQYDAQLRRNLPPTLDLRDCADPQAACRAWLAGDEGAP